jgi:hypothetical protein
MKSNRKCLAHLSLSVLFLLLPTAGGALSQEDHREYYEFVDKVLDITQGENVEQAHTIIRRGARLVYGTRFEELKSVVVGEIKTSSLADTSYHAVMIRAETNPSEDAGYIILKTQKTDTTKVRFHTIVFMKDSAGQYKISAWHAGACAQ